MAAIGHDDHILLVETTGLRQQGVMLTSHYTFKVPYRSLAHTIQSISRRGGKIVRVHSLALFLPPQELFQHSAPVEAVEARRSPSSETDLEVSLPSEVNSEASESTQLPVASETEDSPSPLSVKPEVPKPSKEQRSKQKPKS